MEPVWVTNQQEVIDTMEEKQSLTERIVAKLSAFNQRLEARLRRNQVLLEDMRAEEDFNKSMGYMKEFFGIKGGN